MASQTVLKICSFNSHGLGPGRMDYIKQLCNDCDFVLLQEHWLFDTQFSRFEKEISNISSHCVSGMDSSCLRYGRPYGGCGILWRNNILLEVTPVLAQSKRISAISIKLESCTILLCSVYRPGSSKLCLNDTGRDVTESLTQLTNSCTYDFIIIGGDFNCCFTDKSKESVKDITQFVCDENLFCVSDLNDSHNIKFTFESKANNSQSFIDHFILSNNLINCVESYYVCNDVENPSDHLPLFLHLRMSENIVFKPLSTERNTHNVRWSKASQKDLISYKLTLDYNLDHITIPWDVVHCGNMFCNEHHDDIQSLYDNIINACLDATPKLCNRPDKKSTKRLPGWNELVRDLHQTAMFWHSIWKSSGSPNVGILANIRRSTRAKYHYSVKFLKKTERYCCS